jgi:hypothetical protein
MIWVLASNQEDTATGLSQPGADINSEYSTFHASKSQLSVSHIAAYNKWKHINVVKVILWKQYYIHRLWCFLHTVYPSGIIQLFYMPEVNSLGNGSW